MIPEPVEVIVGGETLAIGPVKMRQLSRVSRGMKGLLHHFQGDTVDIMGMLAEGAEDLTSALSAATDRPEEWIGELTLDDVILLTQTVIEVNADFFARTVLPRVEEAAKGLSKLNLPGRMSSNS